MSKNDSKNDAKTEPKQASGKKNRPAIRKARRARIAVSLKAFAQKVEDAVIASAREHADKDGEAKAEAAIDDVAAWLDEQIAPEGAVGEAVSDAIIYGGRVVIGAFVEGAFQRLRAQARA